MVPDFFSPIFSNMVQGRQKTKKVHPNQVKGLFAFYEFFRFPFQFQVCQFWVTWSNMSNIRLNLTCVMNAVKSQSAVVKLLISRFFLFSFLVPSISILSDSAKHVEHQSALNLTCVMNAVPSDGGQKWPKMVWYKDGKVSIHNNVSDAGRWKTLGVPVPVGIICPPPVRVGFTDLLNIGGGASGPPGPPSSDITECDPIFLLIFLFLSHENNTTKQSSR